MATLTYAMNVSLDGYVAAPGDDLSWGVPSDELFAWWTDRLATAGAQLYGRRLWEAMSSHWPTADQQPGATPAHVEYAQRWRAVPKVVFSPTLGSADGARLVTGDAVAEMERLRATTDGRLDLGGATLAATAVRAGLVDEYVAVTHPVLVGAGLRFLPPLDDRVALHLVESRTFAGGIFMTRYAVPR